MGLFGKKKKLSDIDFNKAFEVIWSMQEGISLEDELNRRAYAGRIIKNISIAVTPSHNLIATVQYDLDAEKKQREERERETQGLTR